MDVHRTDFGSTEDPTYGTDCSELASVQKHKDLQIGYSNEKASASNGMNTSRLQNAPAQSERAPVTTNEYFWPDVAFGDEPKEGLR